MAIPEKRDAEETRVRLTEWFAGVRWYEEDPTLLGSPFYVMDRVEIRRAAGGSEGIGYVGPAVARDCLVRA